MTDLGDVDGDGLADVVASDPWRQRVAAFRGSDGALLWERSGAAGLVGWSVSNAGDLNGDGVADVVAGAPFASSGGPVGEGAVVVLSGVDGSPLGSIAGSQPGSEFGTSVAGVGDVDGDGFSDVVVGAPVHDPAGLVDAGRVELRSGATGALIVAVDGPEGGASFGQAVDLALDFDADGVLDFVAGAPFSSQGGASAGLARVCSGVDGSVLLERSGWSAELFGYSVAGLGDADGDGTPDVAVGGHGVGLGGGLRVFAGGSGALLHELSAGASGDRLGWSLAGAGDVDGDGRPDVIGGATQPFGGAGYARVFSLVTCQADLGFGGPGSAQLSLCGAPLVTGAAATLRLAGAAPNAPAFLVASPSEAHLPLFGGVLVPDLAVGALVQTKTDPSGALTIAVPGGGGAVSVFAQCLTIDLALPPKHVSFSNAVRAEFLP